MPKETSQSIPQDQEISQAKTVPLTAPISPKVQKVVRKKGKLISNAFWLPTKN